MAFRTEQQIGGVRNLKIAPIPFLQVVAETEENTLVFGDRFPFRYLVDDYGLDYYAAFSGCSAETEASFETVIFLADKVNELGLQSIMTLENADTRIAETIRSNTDTKDQQILALDSLQSVAQKDLENDITYLGVMEEDLEILKQALQ